MCFRWQKVRHVVDKLVDKVDNQVGAKKVVDKQLEVNYQVVDRQLVVD